MFFSTVCHVVALCILIAWWYILPLGLVDFISSIFVSCTFLYCSYLLGSFLDTLPRFRVSAKKKAVLITGCDSGFGHLLAHRLDSIGYNVFAGCLFPDAEGAAQLKNSTSDRLQILKLDVTDDASVQSALEEVKINLNEHRLWAIVNNAGVMRHGEAEWMPLEIYKRQFEVNTFGVVRVTQAFLPLLRKSKGRVVTIASFGGRYTFSGFVSYCMTKYATVSFCEGLRMEIAKFGVKVVTIEPFAYSSPLTQVEATLKDIEGNWSKANKELRDEYGGNKYIEVYKETHRKYNKFAMNRKIHEVIDVMVEAVTCTSPHYKYTVGKLSSQLLFWIIMRLPLSLQIYIIRKYMTFDMDLEETVKNREEKKGL